MLDRVLKLIVTLTLLLFLVQAVVGVLSRVLEAALTRTAADIGHVGSLVGSLVVAVVVTCHFVGLLIRGFRFVVNRDPRTARERASRERAIRQRVRRPAEGVPAVDTRQVDGADPDPAIGEEAER